MSDSDDSMKFNNQTDISALGILDPNGLHDNPLTSEPYTHQYRLLGKVWSKYPAYLKATKILSAIKDNQVILIVSGTGSGKTVLLPKFALHYTRYAGKIAVTLPKRVITLSAASFAAITLDVTLGKEVGYLYKGSPKEMINKENKIQYMTDGSLIMKIIKDPLLSEYKVIIIDEAHERKVQIDLLLLFLKKILEKRSDLKVIIMSATIDSAKYQKYFEGLTNTLINISGQPNHKIDTHFLDNKTNNYMETGLVMIDKFKSNHTLKDLLFFITTSNEALQLCKNIRPKYPNIYCVEVYADMDKDHKIYAESREKYLELGNYSHKIIIATNVAESSITIDGLKYVIDSGYELYSYFDPKSMSQILERRLITKAQALQRRGRVGRTEPGVCYHLLTEEQFKELKDYPEPDIKRQDITLDLLKIIQLSDDKTYSSGVKFLNKLMDPPHKSQIDISHMLLTEYNLINNLGGITEDAKSLMSFSSLPLNRALFLIYAYKLFCAEEASIIIAMLEVLNGKISNLFYKADTICESANSKRSSKKLIEKLVEKKGDHLTYLNIFLKYDKITDKKSWVQKYGLRSDLLSKAAKLQKQYYYKMINAAKVIDNFEQNRIDNNLANGKKKVLEALKLSHKHLTAKNFYPEYPPEKHLGQINRDSVIWFKYQQKDLTKKRFIYDELICLNGSWEFNVVTIL